MPARGWPDWRRCSHTRGPTATSHYPAAPGSGWPDSGQVSAPASLFPRIVPFARLDGHVLLVDGQADRAVARPSRRLIRGVAKAILVAQLFLDPAVDRIDSLLPGDFEVGSASLL